MLRLELAFVWQSAMNPKKILILAANPLETAHLRLDEEMREIEEGLRRSKWRDRSLKVKLGYWSLILLISH